MWSYGPPLAARLWIIFICLSCGSVAERLLVHTWPWVLFPGLLHSLCFVCTGSHSLVSLPSLGQEVRPSDVADALVFSPHLLHSLKWVRQAHWWRRQRKQGSPWAPFCLCFPNTRECSWHYDIPFLLLSQAGRPALSSDWHLHHLHALCPSTATTCWSPRLHSDVNSHPILKVNLLSLIGEPPE